MVDTAYSLTKKRSRDAGSRGQQRQRLSVEALLEYVYNVIRVRGAVSTVRPWDCYGRKSVALPALLSPIAVSRLCGAHSLLIGQAPTALVVAHRLAHTT